MKTVFDVIRCPVCGGRLAKDGGSFVCLDGERRHTFDAASSGYVNLLPPGRKNNAVTGDRKDLVKSRTAFLDTGRYDPVSDAVAEYSSQVASSAEDTFCIADFGCGEGYHTCRIAGKLAQDGARFVALGFDASKYAAESGSKRAKRLGFSAPGEPDGRSLSFFAGNFFHPPVFPSSLDCIVSMFAPVARDAAFLSLRDGGGMIVASTGPDHLIELRRLLYQDVERRSEPPETPRGFELAGRKEVRFTMDLDGSEAAMLFGMTPFFCRAPEKAKERVLAAGGLTVTADVYVTFLKKQPGES